MKATCGNSLCGCCAGTEILTPSIESNRPGLPAIAYRAGTWATFYETMIARLSTLTLDVTDDAGKTTRIRPLSQLSTRASDDPAIALLDAWALVGDVLTFYQERIANEGYLMTATERRSVLELARLTGYKLRPGVSASVYLAFTVTSGFQGTLPAGTRAQSQPGTGQTAQFFETSADLVTRDSWNTLQPRLARPQVITLSADPGTDAATRDTLYFAGTSTNLKAGDALLIVLGNGRQTVDSHNVRQPGQQVFRYVDTVAPQAAQNRTEVTLRQAFFDGSANNAQELVASALTPVIDEASTIFAGSDLAAGVAADLANLISAVNTAADLPTAASYVSALIPAIQAVQDVAARRQFSRLEAWVSDLVSRLTDLVTSVLDLDGESVPVPGSGFVPIRTGLAASGIAKLASIVDSLALAPSLQPANSLRLTRTVAATFSPQADTAPRLLAAFKPRAASALYQAWSGIAAPASQVRVYAFRVKASPYGANAPRRAAAIQNSTPQYVEWPLADSDKSSTVSLDANYDKIVPGSWVVLDSEDIESESANDSDPIIAQATGVMPVSRSDYGMAARVTQLGLDTFNRWLPTSATKVPPLVAPAAGASVVNVEDVATLRRVTIWAQPEELELADEPLDTDVEGDTLELAQLYDGIEPGRWIIVSGERTDIANTTGVTASELVMVAAVNQGSRAPLCALFPANLVPFVGSVYTTDANTQGDRLVVGELAGDAAGLAQLTALLPPAKYANQQFCDQVQLAPGLYVNAYVPTQDELAGNFPDFAGLLTDPNGVPYAGGTIPGSVLGTVFAWRISSAPVHTILTLANTLAYSYDSSSVAIYGNVTEATHGQTVGEVLGDGDASQAFLAFGLGQKPLTYVAAATPAGAASTLTVSVNDIEWNEAPDLFSLTPTSRGFITDTDDTDQTQVVFGDGDHGARVPTGSANVKATYRYGIGAAGNVAAGSINQLATHPQGAQGVINPLAASGGADRDSLLQARVNAPLAVMALDRLVSIVDYADFSRSFAGIGKASSVRLSDGRREVVHVSIAGAGDIPIDATSDLYRNLFDALNTYGDSQMPVLLALRRLKLLVISAGIALQPDYEWESVVTNLTASLLAAYGFDARDLGQSAFQSEAIAIMQGVPGVDYVDLQVFDGIGEAVTAAQLATLASTLKCKDYVEAELARPNPAATDATQRILPAELVILTPDIPGTLILTEIGS
ncbi:hypothetical protein LMG28688_05771 [Paraburkholderia caffeinitolerans]|uniref:Baseplate protein J-like domain-containing protein n=1 Tax=Paraburkholderia caffeinitolerans TaxID=1723730 RepID=A0A6J5GQH5_9BURK|nr:putative baseplate assembly protein [Paraburkholderia caffeinitolerans]CAB3803377.1 hypothetical protein LMG28688_05771 [Paraburkholderia caffeinitolerans]